VASERWPTAASVSIERFQVSRRRLRRMRLVWVLNGISVLSYDLSAGPLSVAEGGFAKHGDDLTPIRTERTRGRGRVERRSRRARHAPVVEAGRACRRRSRSSPPPARAADRHGGDVGPSATRDLRRPPHAHVAPSQRRVKTSVARHVIFHRSAAPPFWLRAGRALGSCA